MSEYKRSYFPDFDKPLNYIIMGQITWFYAHRTSQWSVSVG